MNVIRFLLGLPKPVVHPPKFGSKVMHNLTRSGATMVTPDGFAMQARCDRLRRELRSNKP